MALEIPITVGDDYAIRFTIDLEGTTIGLRFRWHDRASGWFLGVYDADGNAIQVGRRINAGTSLFVDRFNPSLPGGQLIADGTIDLTRREYLGTAVRLIYFTAAELA